MIEVPVKEESDEGEPGTLLSEYSESEYEPQAKKTPSKAAQKPKARRRSSVKSKKPVVESDDDDDSDVYEDNPTTQTRRRPALEDSDDELRMGAEVRSVIVVLHAVRLIIGYVGQPSRIVQYTSHFGEDTTEATCCHIDKSPIYESQEAKT